MKRLIASVLSLSLASTSFAMALDEFRLDSELNLLAPAIDATTAGLAEGGIKSAKTNTSKVRKKKKKNKTTMTQDTSPVVVEPVDELFLNTGDETSFSRGEVPEGALVDEGQILAPTF